MGAIGSSQQGYHDLLRTLSEASVEHHFDAFTDVAWDAPENAIDPRDPRWILPSVDALGRTDWYRSLPRERQIEVGFYRQTNVVKVGLQFEQVLIAGLMMYCLDLPNGRPEFRYSTHEATEECHHTQMFQEFVNRTGLDVAGSHTLFRALGPFLPLAAKHLPFIFFIGVLGGEEPIDYVQKVMLRSGEEMHPLLRRISQIHVAEEARHIGFAHQYLEHRAPRLGRFHRLFASVLTPVLMRVLCDAIVVPGKKAVRDMGIPPEVVREVWWESPESREFLRDMFGDVRMLADELGLMNPVSRRVWRALGIAGRSNRFRSEPARAA
ncbi:MAG TPA: diiron oxygenase [Nocardioides sp.]|nr:diiron oxygenase [Nocardioides sp.]